MGCDMFNNLTKKYDVIYADPPWNECGGGKIKRGADRHYPLMKTKDICDMPVDSICSESAHLYLWVTNNFMEAGFDVMRSWGFNYITMISWHKDKIGLGQYFRGQSEHCIFATKGDVYFNSVNGHRQQGTTSFKAKRGKHSKKPNEMRIMIEKVSGGENRNMLEIFAREQFYGWDCWGNEVENSTRQFNMYQS